MRTRRIVNILISFCFVLIVGFVVKFGTIDSSALNYRKLMVSTVKDLVEILIVIVGAVLSYFKFFAGRTFSSKGDLEIDYLIIDCRNNTILHSVTVSLINKGNVTIWNPKAMFKIIEYTNSGDVPSYLEEIRSSNRHLDQNGELITLADVGEKIDFLFERKFNESVWAVKYEVEIIAENGRSWDKSFVIPNEIPK